jgi:hypothetical protein
VEAAMMNTQQDNKTGAGIAQRDWEKAVSYAYPTSITANQLGFGRNGCFYVGLERSMGHGEIECNPIKGFVSSQDAVQFAHTLKEPFSRFTLRPDLDVQNSIPNL